ncbi:MAG TPA: DNA topoisomerase IB [Polyangia bacterium]|nr:DNA topoisomerase IB [Polyangia bacterium]
MRAAASTPVVPAPEASARAAGLRHVDDARPGYRRRPTGRKIKRGARLVPTFAYEDEHGRRLTDAAELERIRRLAIPPAWRNVWICPRADGHIQATGRDARGRKQYRYHPRWREERDGTKYARMIAFGKAIPTLRRRVCQDLAKPGLDRNKVLAAVVRLLETTFIRVGNEAYARANGSFGLTTLEDRHVAFRAAELTFHFRGKSGVVHDVAVHDAKLARIVRQCRDLPGQELFQYIDADGSSAAIDSGDVNEYIRETTGEAFTAKDFRTWAGTVLAAMALDEIGASELAARAAKKPRRPNRRDVKLAIERVAARLGNTPSVCRKSYVHPDVVASYLEGGLSLGQRAASGRRPLGALRLEEKAVLALLQRRAADEKSGGRLLRQLQRSVKKHAA